jgi:hypothetical protein
MTTPALKLAAKVPAEQATPFKREDTRRKNKPAKHAKHAKIR